MSINCRAKWFWFRSINLNLSLALVSCLSLAGVRSWVITFNSQLLCNIPFPRPIPKQSHVPHHSTFLRNPQIAFHLHPPNLNLVPTWRWMGAPWPVLGRRAYEPKAQQDGNAWQGFDCCDGQWSKNDEPPCQWWVLEGWGWTCRILQGRLSSLFSLIFEFQLTIKIKTLKSSHLTFAIHHIVVNPAGRLLAVVGHHQIVVLVLPKPTYSGKLEDGQVEVECVTKARRCELAYIS